MKNLIHTFFTVEELVSFVNKAENCDFDVDLRYRHLLIDGKSLMGVMNIGIGQPVEIICHNSSVSPETLIYAA